MTHLDIRQIMSAASRSGWPDSLVAEAASVAWHISQGADHFTYTIPGHFRAVGLWGVPHRYLASEPPDRLYQAETNAMAAWALYREASNTWAWQPLTTPIADPTGVAKVRRLRQSQLVVAPAEPPGSLEILAQQGYLGL